MHVRDVGLREADDRQIWSWASENRHIIVTADADFVAMAAGVSRGPKVIHIPRCDFRFRVIEDLLRQNAIRIAEFEKGTEEIGASIAGFIRETAIRLSPALPLRVFTSPMPVSARR